MLTFVVFCCYIYLKWFIEVEDCMNKKTNTTEVVKIRLSPDSKKKLQEIADKEYRTFADQCRLALVEWLELKAKRQ
jgi:hypothetical protein